MPVGSSNCTFHVCAAPRGRHATSAIQLWRIRSIIEAHMSKLAVLGGAPERTRLFPLWPKHCANDLPRLQTVLESRNWVGYPFPIQLASEFASDFAAYHDPTYHCCVPTCTLALHIPLHA